MVWLANSSSLGERPAEEAATTRARRARGCGHHGRGADGARYRAGGVRPGGRLGSTQPALEASAPRQPRRALTRAFRARSGRRGAQGACRSTGRATIAQAAAAPAQAAAPVRPRCVAAAAATPACAAPLRRCARADHLLAGGAGREGECQERGSRHPGRRRGHAPVSPDEAARQAGGAHRRRLPPHRRADEQLHQQRHQQDVCAHAGASRRVARSGPAPHPARPRSSTPRR